LSGSRGQAHMLGTVASYIAVASALPYLALKMVWLAGGRLGVADTGMMRDTSMVVLNAVTAGMDLAGIFLALAFASTWGLRVPAWLLLPTMWVATGLLARFIVAVPIVAVASWLVPGAVPRVTGGPVESWVYAVVYTGFMGVGVGLTVAFCCYVSVRWPAIFNRSVIPLSQIPTRRLQLALANTATVIAALPAVILLAWALGATVGLGTAAIAGRTMVGSLINGIDAALMIAGAFGIQLMVRSQHLGRQSWVPVVLTWIGSGSMFGWGLWQVGNLLGQSALMRGLEHQPLINLVGLARLIAGLVVGQLMLFVLAERVPAMPADQESPLAIR